MIDIRRVRVDLDGVKAAMARRHDPQLLGDLDEVARLDTESRRSDAPPERYVFLPGTSPIPAATAPNLSNRPHRIEAQVRIPEGGAEGVLVAFGSRFGGWSLYVHQRRLVYVHNYLKLEEGRLVSDREVPAGSVTLGLRFMPAKPGLGTVELSIDGNPAGRLDGVKTARLGYLGDEGLQVGRNDASPVASDYDSPFAFTGTIEQVVLELTSDANPTP